MRCEILTLGANGQSLAGVFALQSGTVVIEEDHSNKAMQNILASPVLVDGHEFTSERDPVEWMQALPAKYNGAYLRARLQDEGVQKDGVYYAPWIAVDLDGTLATHTDMVSEDRTAIGAPVPKMLDRVKAWLKQGKTVKIFTARVADDPDGVIEDAILEYTKEHLGQYLEVTCEKDPGMTQLWDDKAHGVVEDTGIEKAGSGLLIAFWLSHETAELLAVEGGETPEEMHVTLAYMGKDYDEALLPALETALEKFADTHSPLSGDIGGPSRFTATAHSDDQDVAIASVCCIGIQDFRRDLVECIESVGLHPRNDFEYTPHVTLKYIDPSDDLPVDRIDPIPVTFGAITLKLADQARDIPLTGQRVDEWEYEPEREELQEQKTFEIQGHITKLDGARQLAFGWFSIVEVDGRAITDTQGDIISPDTIEESAYEFVLEARKGGHMHEDGDDGEVRGVGRLVESCVFTKEKCKAIVESLEQQGIHAVMDLGCVGWWGGMKIEDPAIWNRVTTGVLRAWSIGGRGKRAAIKE